MKKLFIVFAAAAIALSLCACKPKEGKKTPKESSSTSTVSSDASQEDSSLIESTASQDKSTASQEKSEEESEEVSEDVSQDVSVEASDEASSDSAVSPLQQSLEKVKKEVIFLSETQDYSLSRLMRNFGIEEDQIEDYAGLFCVDGVTQDQIIYIRAKTEDDVADIQQSLEEYLQATYDVIKNYTPDQAANIENAKVETNGTVVSLVIYSDADKIRSIFNENI